MIAALFAIMLAALPPPQRIPPGDEIIDGKGQRWKMERKVYIEPWKGPSAPNTLDKVMEMATCNGAIYARTMDGQWYRGTSNAPWTLIGPKDPCLQ